MDISERYIRLAHDLDQHIPHLIDGYSGPPEWAQGQTRDPATLLTEATDLLAEVAQIADEQRRVWLTTQVTALHTHARILTGERLSFDEEVRGIYDIEPLTSPFEELDVALQKFQEVLPGEGSVTTRLETLRDRVTIADSEVLKLAEPILDELRERTRNRYGLPEGEKFSIHLVTDKPWGGYNWPLGNLRSRIDINTDFPVVLPTLPDLLAHEGYPGHHTENVHKETELLRVRGWQEQTLRLLFSPESVMAEGLATNALEQVMTEAEVTDWLTGELARRAGLEPHDIAAFLTATRAKENIRNVAGTAAAQLYREGESEEEVVKFLMHYNGVNEERARQNLRFIQFNRGYVYTYTVGHRLVKDFIAMRGAEGFGKLLREPLTPAQMKLAVSYQGSESAADSSGV